MKRTALLLVFLFSMLLMQAQVPAFQKAAWEGDSTAMLKLSEAFFFGNKVEKNEDSAHHYQELAAQKGLPEALFLSGTQHLTQVFSATEFAKGIAYLRKAAEKGHVESQYRLATIYSTKGKGNQTDSYFDLAKAYAFGDSAAKQGHKEALLFCAEARLKGAGVKANDSIAIDYIRKSSEKGFIPAQIRMGDMYWEGRVNKKPEPFEALAWYNKVLATGHANIDQKGQADAGIHRIDQWLKRTQNAYLGTCPAVPEEAFDYRIRK